MNSFWDATFVVVDVETTGSDTFRNRITEVALLVVQGGEIVDEFSSLVNPHQFIPTFIQNMTGITNEMAFKAPEPKEVFSKAFKYFNQPNTIFVAHNVRFDYNFMMESFRREIGEPFEKPLLCTLKLAKKLLPKDLKKNVGSLANFFNIPIINRHRAFGDAEATTYILFELLERAEAEHSIYELEDLLRFQNKQNNNFKTAPDIIQKHEHSLKKLPEESGVYYFKNEHGVPLYIGKAKSLKERVKTYFQAGEVTSKKIADLVKSIDTIEWKETNTELEALLLESKEIKKYFPPFNVQQKRYKSYPLLKITNEDFPRIEKCFHFDDDGAEYFGPFRSRYLVDEIIDSIEKKFNLRKCVEPIIPNEKTEPCIYYQIKRCGAPCADKISKEDYKSELDKVKYYLSGFGNGIINQLELKMQDYAANLDFERAAIIRDQIAELKVILTRNDNVSTSVSDNNLILIIPNSKIEKMVDVFFIKSGKLKHSESIGRKQALHNIFGTLYQIYFAKNNDSQNYSIEDIDELRIINSWLYKQKNVGRYIYTDNKTNNQLCFEFEQIVRNSGYRSEKDDYSFKQI